jgi:hypothetical protein
MTLEESAEKPAEKTLDSMLVPSLWFIAVTQGRVIFWRRMPGLLGRGPWITKPRSLPRSHVSVAKFKRALVGRQPLLELRLSKDGKTATLKLSELAGSGLDAVRDALSDDRSIV